MTWYRIGPRSSSRNSVLSWRCTCALSCTRSSCRNSRRSCFCTGTHSWFCNSVSFGCRSGDRSSSCNRLTDSRRSCSRTGPQFCTWPALLVRVHPRVRLTSRPSAISSNPDGKRARRPSGSSLFVPALSFRGLHSSLLCPSSSVLTPFFGPRPAADVRRRVGTAGPKLELDRVNL
jgi:hypothetical protein